jgi:hypothetical protein
VTELSAAASAQLAEIKREWDYTESVLKVAETTCGEVVFPSIQELRYAGRRLIDALHKMSNGGSDEDVVALLRDAVFDCHRARHDAIDATHAQVAGHLRLAVEYLGIDVLIGCFPPYHDLLTIVLEIDARIASARRARENRDPIYSEIAESEFLDMIRLYRAFLASEEQMKAVAARKQQEKEEAERRLAEETEARRSSDARANESDRRAEDANRLARRNLWVAIVGVIAAVVQGIAGIVWK